ncbi:hypothetical protein OROMI_020374 [Orobanche minor]
MSRICVKSLPKYVAEDRLRDHFSQKGEVTDAKIMRTKNGISREFGFVGFRTEHEAEEAIRYFNKSYMDTCKITCEIARKVGDPDIPRPWSRHSLTKKENSSEDEKRVASSTVSKAINKTSRKDAENDDPQLQEFIQVMQHRSKSKLWANDTLVAPSREQGESATGKNFQMAKGHEEKLDEEVAGPDGFKGEGNFFLEKQVADIPDIQVHDKVVSDIEYFQSRIKKKWYSESSGDEVSVEGTNHTDSDDNDDNGDSKSKSNHDPAADTLEPNVSEGKTEDGSGDRSADPSSSPGNKHDEVLESGRLFIRNLPYSATEEELQDHFSKYGTISQVHIVIDKDTRRSVGLAYVLFAIPEAAARKSAPVLLPGSLHCLASFCPIMALKEMDGSIFQGRLLHVMPAKQKNQSDAPEINNASKTLKQQRISERKESEATGNIRAWNTLFMRPDTIVENIARKYGVSKSELLDRESDDLAARVALGETQVIAETKKALSIAGVNISSLEEFATGKTDGLKRSNHVILVKNLPYGSSEGELSEKFGKFGSLDKIILPPTKTLAVVVFLEPAEARAAFRGLAYKRFKDAPLYLEWAPSNIMSQASNVGDNKIGELDVKRALLERQVEDITDTDVDPDRIE